jgi:hypothetical protein
MGYKVDGVLTAGQSPPWLDEVDYSTFYVNPRGNAGPVSEVAFFTGRPRPWWQRTPLLLFRMDPLRISLPPTLTMLLWPRIVLQSVFLPLHTASRSALNANMNANVPAGNDLDFYYPPFDALRNRLIRAPILRGFTDARAPVRTCAWIDTIANTAGWKYDRIITCHFASPIAATPAMVRNTFSFLEEDGSNDRSEPPIACQDWELLNTLNDVIAQNKLGAPASFDYTRGCLKE